MQLSITILLFIAALAIQYLLIYLPYLIISRKHATPGSILKTSLVVALYSLLAGVLCGFTGISNAAAIGITAVLVYQMGRRKLLQSNKQAWASCGIYIGCTITMVILMVYFMVTSEAFRSLMLEMVQE